MFKYLTEDYWGYFFKTIIRNNKEKPIHDGKHFEELTYSLLENLFQNEDILWLPTPETHDGNRDFYAKDSNGNVLWAECKNYHNNIELKNIAATIVMVQINKVSEILFFSYSSINRSTKEKLIIYANQNNKKIYFYDDTNLENLIFKYRENIIPQFFPKFNYSPDMEIDYKPYIFTKYGNGIFVSTTESKTNSTLKSRLNDIVYIGIGISNRNPQQDLCIKISMETENDLRYFELLDTQYKGESSCYYQISDTLFPMVAKFYTVFFRISVYKKNLKLPNLIIKYVTGNISESYSIHTPFVEIDHMFMTGLIGSGYHDILNDFKNTFFSNNCLKVNYLRGKSGVGKTRMLYEYINILLTEKYQIINFTSVSQENSSIYIIKEIVYKLYNLSEALIIESLKNPISHINVLGDDTTNVIELLQNMIQGNTDALIKCESLIFEKLIQTRVAILIDNIQYVDGILIDFLLHYLLYAKNVNRPNNCIIILAQNIEYFENTKLKNLHLILNSLSENNFIKISINELKGFEENQALGFLKAVVNFKDNSFNNILLKLVEKANNNPKLILEIVKYLRQRQIIKIQNDSLLLKNYSDLKDELKNFPLGSDNIIERRWKTYIENKPDVNKIKLLLSAIHFLGKVTVQLCKEIHICFNYLGELHMIGFLATNKQNEYFFEHDIIEAFFMKDINFSSSVIDYLSNIEYININLQVWQKNLINIKKQDIPNFELEILLKFIYDKTLDIPYKWQLYYFDTVTSFLLGICNRINDKTQLIYSLHHICLKTKNVFGTETANKLYNIIYYNLEHILGDERYKFRPYLELLDGYTENLLHMGAYNVRLLTR